MNNSPRDNPIDETPLQGARPLTPELLEHHGPAGPWNAEVLVERIDFHGQPPAFRVTATRQGGPPLSGTPPLRPGQTVHVTDQMQTPYGDHARYLAQRAFEQLSHGDATELRLIGADL